MTTKNQHKNTPMNKDAAHALQQKRHSVSTHWKKYNSHHHLGKNFTTKIIFWFVPFHTSVTTLTSNYKEKTLATKTQQTSNSWQWCTSGRETPFPFRRPKKQTENICRPKKQTENNLHEIAEFMIVNTFLTQVAKSTLFTAWMHCNVP